MIKYFFCAPVGKHWLDAAIMLKQESIAEPILFIGDWSHYFKAKNVFGDCVKHMDDFVHYPFNLKNIEYSGEFYNFFESQNYMKAKDICLKMMDRLDLYGNFSRINREAYFHNLVMYFLKYVSINKPDIFFGIENPHSHAQYLLFEICTYLKIPSYKFSNWVFNPLLIIENINTGERFEYNNRNISDALKLRLQNSFKNYISDLTKNKYSYEIYYMREQRNGRKFIRRIKTFFTSQIKKEIKEVRHNLGLLLTKKISYINPYQLNYFTRLKIKTKRKKQLINSYKKNIQKMDYNKKYIYFPLHYEPERTSNPDGGIFHDQLKALINLRNIVPGDIQIVVKEHPTQFNPSFKGTLGRSSLFYDLVRNILNVKLISVDENSIKLILNSEFVATLTGTVAIEASILGKNTLYFGNPWYRGLPNTFDISNSPTYEDLLSSKISNVKKIENFFIHLFDNYSIPAYMNGGQKSYFQNDYMEFIDEKLSESLFDYFKQFFIMIEKNKIKNL